MPERRDPRFPPALCALALALLVGCAPTAGTITEATQLEAVAGPTWTVTLSDPGGDPLDGWVVLWPGGRDAQAIAGRAEFASVQLGDYRVTGRAPGHQDAWVDVVIDGDGESALTLAAAATGAVLWGRVERPAGGGVEGAQIVIDGAALSTTGADGGWRIEELAAGEHALTIEPPAGAPLLSWSTTLDLVDGQAVQVSASLAAVPPTDAHFVGSGLCWWCHAGQVDRWEQSAHGDSRRTVTEAARHAPALAASFEAGETIPLPGGGSVLLGAGAGWTAEVRGSGGSSSGPLPVVELYGGHHAGYAVAVRGADQRLLLPVGWSLGAPAPTGADPAPGWVPAWTEGWLQAGALRSPPGPEASFDLSCAGCHATGYSIAEGAGWSLEPAPMASAVEGAVGCEACHGPAGSHPEPAGGRVERIHQPGRMAAGSRLDVCSRCHQRVAPDVHPLSATPGVAVDGQGSPLAPWLAVTEAGAASSVSFDGLTVSPLHRDQVSALAGSGHRDAYLGACADCHDPHGSEHPASLRVARGDNTLCTACHRAAFPDEQAERDHAGHLTFGPTTGGPGACADCHLARAGLVLSRDAVSGVGETHDHGLAVWTPDDVLAIFDAAGADTLPIEDVPVTACLDCHLRAQAKAEDNGGDCGCPQGDPTLRSTWVQQQQAWTDWLGAP